MNNKFIFSIALKISTKTKYDDVKKIQYGITVFCLQCSLFISMLVLFGTYSKVSYMLCFMIPLVFVRRFLGGYHFKKFSQCIIATNMICAISIYISKYMNYNQFVCCNLISTSFVLLFKPIADNTRKSRIVNTNEKMGKAILIVLFLLIILLDYSNFRIYLNIISLSITTVAIALIIEKCLLSQ